MAAGFDVCRGRVVVTLDGDLQNDPADIPAMLAKLDEGFDIVCGWRRDRKDRAFTRKVPSWIANRMIAASTGVDIHDTGCTLKAYRSWVVRKLHLYSDQHRFIPALAAGVGAKVGELPVQHHPRRHGSSKYGIGRTLKVMTDMLVVRLLSRFAAHPVRYFGLASVPLSILAVALALVGLFEWGEAGLGLARKWDNYYMTGALVLAITSLNLFMLGLLSELSVSISRFFAGAGIEVQELRPGRRAGARA
ncbi:MAG: glycosyltransferase [Planctomycetota bacterium]